MLGLRLRVLRSRDRANTSDTVWGPGGGCKAVEGSGSKGFELRVLGFTVGLGNLGFSAQGLGLEV